MAKAYPNESLFLKAAPELKNIQNHKKYIKFINVTLTAFMQIVKKGKLSPVKKAELNSLSGDYKKIADALVERFLTESKNGNYKKGSQACKNISDFIAFYTTDAGNTFFNNLLRSGVDIDWIRFFDYLHDETVVFEESDVVKSWIDMVEDLTQDYSDELSNN